MSQETDDKNPPKIPLDEPGPMINPTEERKPDTNKDRQAIIEILEGGNDVDLPWIRPDKPQRGQV